MTWLVRVLLVAAVSLAHAQSPVQEVQQAAPHLVAFSGSPINFQSLVQGLAQGRPVLLSTTYANGMAEVATFTPAGPMPVADIVNALEQARLQLASLALAQPSATQLATALAGGTLARPNVQLGGLVPTHAASPGVQTQLVMVAAPSASAGGSAAPAGAPAAGAPSYMAIPPEAAAGVPPAMTPGLSSAPSPLVTPSPAPVTMTPPATPGQPFYAPPANVPGAR